MYWETLYPLHWRIFAEHLLLDDKEELERARDLAEYTMAFHNYEAVQAVQEARAADNGQSRQTSQSASDEAFFKQLQDMGINLDGEKLQQARDQAIVRERRQERSVPSSRQGVQQDIMRVHKGR